MQLKIAMVNTEQTRGGAARMVSILLSGLNEYTNDVNAVLYHCENNSVDNKSAGFKKFASRQLNAGAIREWPWSR